MQDISTVQKQNIYIYEHLTPKNIAELKLWDSVHVDLICTYRKSIGQQHLGSAIICKDGSMTCITRIDPATGLLKIFETLTFELNEATSFSEEYIDKSSARVRRVSSQNVPF